MLKALSLTIHRLAVQSVFALAVSVFVASSPVSATAANLSNLRAQLDTHAPARLTLQGRVPVEVIFRASDAMSNPSFDMVERVDYQSDRFIESGPIANGLNRTYVTILPAHARRYYVSATNNVDEQSQTESSTMNVNLIQESSPLVDYTGSWRRLASDSASGGAMLVSGQTGAMASVHFFGRSVAWYSPVGVQNFSADVFVDGDWAASVVGGGSGYSPRLQLFAKNWPDNGHHVVTISRQAGRIHVDAFGVIVRLPRIVPSECEPSYPLDCIPPPPATATCASIGVDDIQVIGADPYNLDADHNGIGCERHHDNP